MGDLQKPEAQAVAELCENLALPHLITAVRPAGEEAGKAAVFVALPKGKEIISLKSHFDEYLPRPERRTGEAALVTLESFIAHVKRFADDATAIFADPGDGTDPKLVAVLNYHKQGAAGLPAWCDHRASYAFPIADEWGTWLGMNGKQLSQAEFAEFIEARITDVMDPAAAGKPAKEIAASIGAEFAGAQRLMELARGLSVREGRRVTNAVNLASGEANLQFAVTHDDGNGAPVKVPGAFLLAIPVFRSGALYQVPVRLRYRVREGSILWSFALYRTDRIFDHAFTESCQSAQQQTLLPLFYGTPEDG